MLVNKVKDIPPQKNHRTSREKRKRAEAPLFRNIYFNNGTRSYDLYFNPHHGKFSNRVIYNMKVEISSN